jgi:hypothetical protein
MWFDAPMRIGWDDSFTRMPWPLSRLRITSSGALAVGRARRRELGADEIRRVIRCGLVVQWGIRVVPSVGDRILLWAPRLPSRIGSALPVPLERESRRTLVQWYRIVD